MTKEEIINLAKASGFHFQTFQAHAPIQHTVESAYSEKCFERFANLILEKAAEIKQEAVFVFTDDATGLSKEACDVIEYCAEAIRSMKV